MASLLPAYQAGQLLIVHATGSTDPSRSHFDAQYFMEIGKPGDMNVVTGWLGRHLASRPPMRADAALRAIGFAFGLPQTLVGAPGHAADSRSGELRPLGQFERRARSAWPGSGNAYATERDPLKTAALNTQRTITTLSALNIAGYVPAGGAVYPGGSFGAALRSTAALIRADIGVEAVQIDIGGWDTHSAQGPLTGGMAANMTQLAQGARGVSCRHGRRGPHGPRHGRRDLGVRPRGPRERQPGHRPRARQRDVRDGRRRARRPRHDELAGPRRPASSIRTRTSQVTIDYRDILAEIVLRRLGQHEPRSRVPRLHADDARGVHHRSGTGISAQGCPRASRCARLDPMP